jgi:hypothetical protein
METDFSEYFLLQDTGTDNYQQQRIRIMICRQTITRCTIGKWVNCSITLQAGRGEGEVYLHPLLTGVLEGVGD